jgi:hypothetical protein
LAERSLGHTIHPSCEQYEPAGDGGPPRVCAADLNWRWASLGEAAIGARTVESRKVICRPTAGWRRLYLTSRVNGRGFDQNRILTPATSTFGLIGMRERAREFEGDVVIATAPGHGTTVRATLKRRALHHWE